MDDVETTDETAGRGFTRRSLLKAGAVVGGAVWVAPVVDSFMSKAAATSAANGFPCSYANVIYTVNSDANHTQYVVRLLKGGSCSPSNNDGSYNGDIFPPCNGTTYGVDNTNVVSTYDSSATPPTFTALAIGDCSYFTVNGGTVSWSSAITVQYVIIHDGSFPSAGLGTCVGAGASYSAGCFNTETLCAPSGSFTVPSGYCGT